MPEPYQEATFYFEWKSLLFAGERVKSVNYKCKVCVLMIPGNLKTNRAAAWLTVVIKER